MSFGSWAPFPCLAPIQRTGAHAVSRLTSGLSGALANKTVGTRYGTMKRSVRYMGSGEAGSHSESFIRTYRGIAQNGPSVVSGALHGQVSPWAIARRCVPSVPCLAPYLAQIAQRAMGAQSGACGAPLYALVWRGVPHGRLPQMRVAFVRHAARIRTGFAAHVGEMPYQCARHARWIWLACGLDSILHGMRLEVGPMGLAGERSGRMDLGFWKF